MIEQSVSYATQPYRTTLRFRTTPPHETGYKQPIYRSREELHLLVGLSRRELQWHLTLPILNLNHHGSAYFSTTT